MFNCEKYIEKNIKSILNQNYSNFELIIINDGSTDNSLNIIKSFHDKRIKIIDKKREGVAKTRNLGLKISKGKYIYFIDADDYIEKNTLKKFVNVVDKFNPDLIICGIYSETYKHNKIDMLNYKETFYKNSESIKKDIINLYNNNLLYNVWNKFFKKDIIERNKLEFPDIQFGEDHIFNQNYLKYCKTAYNINECLYHYVRETENSITTKYIPNLPQIRINENKMFIEFFQEYKIEYNKYIEFITKHYIERTIGCLENIHRKNNLSIKEKLNETNKIIHNEETEKYLKLYKSNNKKIKIILSTYKFKTPIIPYIIGFCLHTIKTLTPNFFNQTKNKR